MVTHCMTYFNKNKKFTFYIIEFPMQSLAPIFGTTHSLY